MLLLIPTQGPQLLGECQAAVRVLDALPGRSDPSDYPLADACISYIDGFTDGLALTHKPSICLDAIPLGAMARTYVVYLHQHPELVAQPQSTGLLQALESTYPCPKASLLTRLAAAFYPRSGASLSRATIPSSITYPRLPLSSTMAIKI